MSDKRDSRVAHADNLQVDFSRYCAREYFLPREYRVDFAVGAAGLARPYMSRFFRPAIEQLAAGRTPAVIFIHEGHYAATALPLFRRRFPSSQLVYYVHSTISRSYTPWELRRLTSGVDLIVGVSEFMANHARARLRRSTPKVVGLLNGVDATFFTPASEKAAVDGPHRLRLLFVGQVAHHKGVHLLLEALRCLPSRMQAQIDLRIVGSSVHAAVRQLSPYEAQLRADAQRLPSRVTFMPFQEPEALLSHYRWADLSVVPSLFEEPCGLVVLEAMACGTPVLGTRSGGIPEVVLDAGILVDRSAASIAEGIAWSLTSTETLRELGSKARSRALTLTWASRLGELDRQLG